jgi:hypothetical protein
LNFIKRIRKKKHPYFLHPRPHSIGEDNVIQVHIQDARPADVNVVIVRVEKLDILVVFAKAILEKGNMDGHPSMIVPKPIVGYIGDGATWPLKWRNRQLHVEIKKNVWIRKKT